MWSGGAARGGGRGGWARQGEGSLADHTPQATGRERWQKRPAVGRAQLSSDAEMMLRGTVWWAEEEVLPAKNWECGLQIT